MWGIHKKSIGKANITDWKKSAVMDIKDKKCDKANRNISFVLFIFGLISTSFGLRSLSGEKFFVESFLTSWCATREAKKKRLVTSYINLLNENIMCICIHIYIYIYI